MKKKLMMVLLAVALCVTSIYSVDIQANAEENIEEEVDYESLLTEGALTGHMASQTWGVYLVSGTSTINDAGSGKIGAGGSTTAATYCKVSVNVVVERKVSGSWVRVTSWSSTKSSALVVSTGKTISVASGYYYRVRCVHNASTDSSSSCTGALWM